MAAGSTPPGSRDEALAYIFEMATALRELAHRHELYFLAYLLEMAALAAVKQGKDS